MKPKKPKKKNKKIQKCRFLFLHFDTNQNKILALEELHSEYLRYLRSCVDTLISQKITNLIRSEYKNFFPKENILSACIVQTCQHHAINIVSSWVKSKYATVLKSKVSHLKRQEEISEDDAKILYTIGKHNISKPNENIPQKHIDQFKSWLFDEEICGRTPTVSDRTGMKTTVQTGVLDTTNKSLSNWWFALSCLKKGKRVQLPLVPNPFVKTRSDLVDSAMIRKDKRGRWRIELIENKEHTIPAVENPKKIGVDVGLNCLAATSDSKLYGQNKKKVFDKKYDRIRKIRANRQRQGLKTNSKRLDILEDNLTGFVKTETGRIANKMIRSYPNTVFVMEDLDLKGCRGQKRFAYRKLQSNLEMKANTDKVNAAYTSQMCASCGYTHKSNRKGIRFHCRGCGKKTHADIQGGINLLRRSGDDEVNSVNKVSEVKTIVNMRYVSRRNSKVDSIFGIDDELRACNRELTFSGRESRETALKAEGNSK